MRVIAFLLVLSFCQSQEKTLLEEKLVGNWGICFDSLIDNPPTFLTCKYSIVFNKSGGFKIHIINGGKLVEKGNAKLKYDSEINGKKLYKLSLTKEGNMGFRIDDYFPSDCIVFFSDDSVIFLTDDKKDVATPYFLKKNKL